MAALPIIMAGASVLSSMESSAASAEQIQNQAEAQAAQSAETLLQGRSQASSIRSQKDSITGAARAAAAGSGIQVDTGSVADVIEESAYNIELDALTVEADAKRASENMLETSVSTSTSTASSMSTLLGAFGSGASGYSSGLQLQG